MNKEKIIGFTKVKLPYGWLGNMSAFPINYEGKIWKTSEALFQALRFEDEQIKEELRMQESPMGAKMKAKKNRLMMKIAPRSAKDIENMRMVLALKFEQHPNLANDLIKTKDALLYENIESRRNTESNLFWGARLTTDNKLIGQNKLGILLMELREKLKN
jgi:ribA/ribD-fused uncharacterized protein